MTQIRFGINMAEVSDEDLHVIMSSVNAIEDITHSISRWCDRKGDIAYIEYTCCNDRRKESARSMLNDVRLRFPFVTVLED